MTTVRINGIETTGFIEIVSIMDYSKHAILADNKRRGEEEGRKSGQGGGLVWWEKNKRYYG